MMKDRIRDYATEAFRDYAANGCRTYEETRAEIYNDALLDAAADLRHGGKKAPELSAIRRAEKAVELATPYLLDILAVEKTLDMFREGGKSCIADAVNIVYFTDAKRPLQSGTITARVRHAMLILPAAEKTIYRYLRQARRLFAEVRGLSCEKLTVTGYRNKL